MSITLQLKNKTYVLIVSKIPLNLLSVSISWLYCCLVIFWTAGGNIEHDVTILMEHIQQFATHKERQSNLEGFEQKRNYQSKVFKLKREVDIGWHMLCQFKLCSMFPTCACSMFVDSLPAKTHLTAPITRLEIDYKCISPGLHGVISQYVPHFI